MKYVRSYKHKHKFQLLKKYNRKLFKKYSFDMVTSVYPTKIAEEIVPVMLLTEPPKEGIFHLTYEYGKKRKIPRKMKKNGLKRKKTLSMFPAPLLKELKKDARIQTHSFEATEVKPVELGYVEGDKVVFNSPVYPEDKISIQYLKEN